MDVRRRRPVKARPRTRVRDPGPLSHDIAERILNSVPVGVVHISLNGAVSYANSLAAQFLGLSYDELAKTFLRDFKGSVFYEDGQPCPVKDFPVSKCFATGKAQPAATLSVRRRDQQLRWGIFSVVPDRNGDGELSGAIVTFTDITQRREVEQALRESEERYRQLVELCPDGIFIHSDSKIVFANRAMGEIVGAADPAELLGRPVFDLVHSDYRTLVQNRIKQITGGDTMAPWLEQKLLRLNGGVVEVEVSARPLRLKSASAIQVMVRDITERKRSEHEREELFRQVEQARARLEVLSRRLVDVQEAERRKVARELHDHVGQELTALKLDLERFVRIAVPDKGMRSLQAARTRVDNLVKLVREMSLDLRPAMLDDLGLLPALHWQFDRFARMSGVHVSFKHSGVTTRRFPPEIETAAYRIVQEALTNVIRHSEARDVAVRLWASSKALSVQVQDSGIGFDPEDALAAGASSGLSGMRERASLLGGHFSIESAPGTGTRLTAQFSLK